MQNNAIDSITLRNIKIHIDNNEYNLVSSFFNTTNYDDINTKFKNGFITLKIRYLINMNDYNSVFNIMDKYNLMKRDYITTCISIYNVDQNISAYIFKNYVIKKCKIESYDIDKLISNKCFELFRNLDGYFVSCSKMSNITNKDYNNFKKYPLDMKIKKKLFDFYKNKLKQKYFDKLLTKVHDIDCIVDGGNISHMNGGKCDYKYINKISNMILKQYKNPLYIFHNRHKNNIKDFLKNNNHFITPANEYDDYYIIIAMILSDKPIISNDHFRDHIYELMKDIETNDCKIKNYITENTINYTKTMVNKTNKYSKCIQIHNNNIYIPTKLGMYKFI